IGASKVVKLDLKSSEVPFMMGLHLGDHFLFTAALFLGAHHDGGAVGVVSTNIKDSMPPRLLKTDPDVRLEVLDQMSQMNVPVGIGERARHKNAARRGGVCSHNAAEGSGSSAS